MTIPVLFRIFVVMLFIFSCLTLKQHPLGIFGVFGAWILASYITIEGMFYELRRLNTK